MIAVAVSIVALIAVVIVIYVLTNQSQATVAPVKPKNTDDSKRSGKNFWKLASRTLRGKQTTKDEDRKTPPDFRLFPKEISAGGVSYTVGDRVLTFQLHQPLSLKDVQSSNASGVDNTGAMQTWPAEEIMAYYCLRRSAGFKDFRVLELGAGMTGLAGLSLALTGAPKEIVVTDGSPVVLPLLKANIERNVDASGSKVRSRLLKWDRTAAYAELGQFDVILMADCLFFDQYHDDLLHVLNSTLSIKGRVLSFAPRRGDTLQRFKKKAEKMFSVELIEDYSEVVSQRWRELKDGFRRNWDYPVMMVLSRK